MIKLLEIVIGAIILSYFVYEDGKIIFSVESKKININIIIAILLLAAFTTVINLFNSEIFKGVFKILCVYVSCCMFCKVVFRKTLSKTLIGSLIIYSCMFVSEVITVLIASGVLELFGNSIVFMKNNIVLNTIIFLLTFSLIKLFSKQFKFFINNTNFQLKNSFIIVIILITMALLVYKIPLKEWKLDAEFIVTMLILLCFCIVGIYLIKQNSDIQKRTSMYQQVVKYSNTTNKLLEDYRMVSHEHKNQLSIIRQMLGNDNKELIDYIDNLIDKRNDIKYKWVADLSHIPLAGLKGLINYKLLEMEDNKINAVVTISKEISKFKLEKLSTKQKDSLYSIVGVYLDNAIQAASNAKKKEVSLEIYKENKDMVLLIANTYKGKINIDKIDDYGYTTKGRNHGVGLHIVRKILDEDNMFSQSRKLIDGYYIQELRIHTNEINQRNKKRK